MENTNENLEQKESSAFGDSKKRSCSEAPHTGASGQNPVEQGAGETPLIGEEPLSPSNLSSENLEGLTEKVCTLGLQDSGKNCFGAAKKRARKAMFAESPTGDSGSGQPQSSLGSQQQILQTPSISGAQHGRGLKSAGPKSPESKGHPQGPSKRQWSTRGIPKSGQAKKPKQGGQISYTRAFRWQLYVRTIWGVKSPGRTLQISSGKSAGSWMSSLKREAGQFLLGQRVCHEELTRDCLVSRLPTLVAWEGSRFKMVGLDALPTCKRVAAWFPGPVEETER
jgi:hypothetical protein